MVGFGSFPAVQTHSGSRLTLLFVRYAVAAAAWERSRRSGQVGRLDGQVGRLDRQDARRWDVVRRGELAEQQSPSPSAQPRGGFHAFAA